MVRHAGSLICTWDSCMEGISWIGKSALQKYEKHDSENIIPIELWKSIFSKHMIKIEWYTVHENHAFIDKTEEFNIDLQLQ